MFADVFTDQIITFLIVYDTFLSDFIKNEFIDKWFIYRKTATQLYIAHH